MGYNKITNLLGKLDKDETPKFTTIKWIEFEFEIEFLVSLMELIIQIKILDLKHHK